MLENAYSGVPMSDGLIAVNNVVNRIEIRIDFMIWTDRGKSN